MDIFGFGYRVERMLEEVGRTFDLIGDAVRAVIKVLALQALVAHTLDSLIATIAYD